MTVVRNKKIDKNKKDKKIKSKKKHEKTKIWTTHR